MTSITAAERVFLARAEVVTEKKRTRAAHYEQQLQDLIAELQPGDISKVSKPASENPDATRKNRSRTGCPTPRKPTHYVPKQHTDQAIIRLCAEANKLAGTDGANFFTKAGKVFIGETPDERNDDRTAK